MQNIWILLLSGLSYVVRIYIIPAFFGGPAAYHQAMGMAQIIGSGAFVVLEVSMVALGQFNLLLPLTAIGISLLLFFIRLGINIWLTIKNIIKVW